MKIILTHLRGIYAGNKTEYEGTVLKIGRDPRECGLVYGGNSELGVSRLHAKLLVEADKVYVEDLKSRNGTFLDGVQVREKTLVLPGSVLQFGPEGPALRVEYEPQQQFLIVCKKCGAGYSEPMNFCRKCGHPLQASEHLAKGSSECSGCGAKLTGQERFCPACGTAVKQEPADAAPVQPPTAAISVKDARKMLGMGHQATTTSPEPESPEKRVSGKLRPPIESTSGQQKRKGRKTTTSPRLQDTTRSSETDPQHNKSLRTQQIEVLPEIAPEVTPKPSAQPISQPAFNKDEVATAYKRAQEHALAGRLTQAVDACTQILSVAKEHAGAYALLGQCLTELKRLPEAIEALEKAVSLKPSAETYIALSQSYLRLGRYEDAALAARNAIRLNQSMPEAYYTIGQALLEMGQLIKAYEAFQHALSVRDDYPDAYLGIAAVELRRRNFDAALTACRKAIKAQPKAAQNFCMLGQILRAMGKHQDAYLALQDALKLDPRHAPAFNYIALNFRSQNRLEEAETACRKGLKIIPIALNYTTLSD